MKPIQPIPHTPKVWVRKPRTDAELLARLERELKEKYGAKKNDRRNPHTN